MVCNSKVESDNAGGRQCPSFQRNQINKAGVKSSVRPGKAAMQPAIDLEELEAKLGQHENDLLEMNTNSEKLLQTWCNAGEGISDDNDASASSSQVVYLIALKTKELEHAENERVIFLCNPNLLVLSSYVMYGRNYQRRKKGNAVAQSTAREGRVCC
uniref:V-type proton ATPase subunit a n=1 Tax=Leersia perrieri TaxID=77586 RepID=A0A0D9WEY8_9ORYZ